MKQKRIVGYVEEPIHQEFMEALREEGMTLSGWLRKIIRQYLKKRSEDIKERKT